MVGSRGRPRRRSAHWRMASSVHQRRTICGMQMRMMTAGHDAPPVGAWAARNTTAESSHRRRQTDHRRRMLGSATTAPTSTARFLYPELLWLEALRRGAVDGVFIARPDGDNLKAVSYTHLTLPTNREV